MVTCAYVLRRITKEKDQPFGAEGGRRRGRCLCVRNGVLHVPHYIVNIFAIVPHAYLREYCFDAVRGGLPAGCPEPVLLTWTTPFCTVDDSVEVEYSQWPLSIAWTSEGCAAAMLSDSRRRQPSIDATFLRAA